MTALHTTQSFPPSVRLHKPAQFAPALKGRRIGREDWLVLTTPRMATPNTAQTAGQARLGMIIAKRYAKLAVTRNAIKRALREAFRHQQAHLPPHDYVFRLHNRIQSQSLTHVKRETRNQADALLQQARLNAG